MLKVSEKAEKFWLNVSGLSDTKTISALGTHFDLHGLVLEAILDTEQLPHVAQIEHSIFFTLKMLTFNESKSKLQEEHISLILGKNWIISLQEKPGDIFDQLRTRIVDGQAKVCHKSVDYLFYRIIDTVVDHYFVVDEFFSNLTDELELELLERAEKDFIDRVQFAKKELMKKRRVIAPVKDSVRTLLQSDTNLVEQKHHKYLKDLENHVGVLLASIDYQRELLKGLSDQHLSRVSYSMNQVMQTLTIIATIFIPLTFIAGIYGMNFTTMPELDHPYGYIGALGLMALVGLIMVAYMKRKKWF